MVIRVIIVEDDPEVRKLTAGIINLYQDLECVGLFDSAESFMEGMPSLLPDVVLMDLSLPKMSGSECVKVMRQKFPVVNFVMFTIHLEPEKVFQCFRNGAKGYILKGSPPEVVAEGIREVYSGGGPMSKHIARLVLASFVENDDEENPELQKLTPQERLVLEKLAKGKTYKQIAAEHFVELSTIKSQVQSIYKKLEVNSRIEAINKVYGKKDGKRNG